LKWRYRDEDAEFELNWAFFFFGLEAQALFQKQNGSDLVTRQKWVTVTFCSWIIVVQMTALGSPLATKILAVALMR
jgi:hypothetical protein